MGATNLVIKTDFVSRIDLGTALFVNLDCADREPLSNSDMARAIYVHGFTGSLREPGIVPYTALTAAMMSAARLSGKCVLDLGASDGALSLIAAKMGARKIVAVELEDLRAAFYLNVEANGWAENKFRFIQRDMVQPGLAELIASERINVVVANMGPQYYGAEVAAISLLRHLPQAKYFIGGGYYDGDHARTYKKLARHGFKISLEKTDVIGRLAFVAERNN